MKKILLSEDAFADLNKGFLFYEAQEFGLATISLLVYVRTSKA